MTHAMRVLLALLVLVLLAGDGEALFAKRHRRHRQRRERVVVLDATRDGWAAVVRETVDDLNAILPRRAPRLVYRRLTEQPCDVLPDRWQKRRILVCHGSEHVALVAGRMRARISPRAALPPSERFLCHEFMHATTNIPDNYNARPDDSCVWGLADDPGAFDRAYARQAWPKRHRRHRHR